MRVLWIPERFAPDRGGVATAATRQVLALAPLVERLDVLTLGTGTPPGHAEGFEVGGARVHRVGRAPRDEESLQILFEAAVALGRAERHDLVHGFYAVPAGYVAALAARHLRRPSLVSLRGNDVDVSLFVGSRLAQLQWTLEHATALTAVSREMIERVRAFTDRSAALHHVPNAVDTTVFSPGTPTPDDVRAFDHYPRPWIAFAGEARLKKGLPTLLAVACRLAEQDAGTLFLVGGVRRDARDAFERWLAAEPRAAARVCELPYTKNRSTLVSYYRAMDLFVFPSAWDGMPNALLEVMACGKPAIATAVGGIPEIIEDGVSGFLVALDALDRFPDRVLQRLDANLIAIGERARSRVTTHFAPSREIDTLLGLYRAVVSDTAA